jgi:type I restriction enzyme S subunit
MAATTVPGIGREEVEQLRIPLPILSEQRQIVERLEALQTQVGSLKHLQADTASELDALMPSILDKAFRGEL